MTTMARKTGTVVRMINERGFGFLRSADGTEYFLHHSSVMDGTFSTLNVGDLVAFVAVDNSAKGPRAENAQRLRA